MTEKETLRARLAALMQETKDTVTDRLVQENPDGPGVLVTGKNLDGSEFRRVVQDPELH